MSVLDPIKKQGFGQRRNEESDLRREDRGLSGADALDFNKRLGAALEGRVIDHLFGGVRYVLGRAKLAAGGELRNCAEGFHVDVLDAALVLNERDDLAEHDSFGEFQVIEA